MEIKVCGHSDIAFARVQHAPLTVMQKKGCTGWVPGPGFGSIAPGGHLQVLVSHAQDTNPIQELGSEAVAEGKRSHKAKTTLPPNLKLEHKTQHLSVSSSEPGFLPGLSPIRAALVRSS